MHVSVSSLIRGGKALRDEAVSAFRSVVLQPLSAVGNRCREQSGTVSSSRLPDWPADVLTRGYGILPSNEFVPLDEVPEMWPLTPDQDRSGRQRLRWEIEHRPQEHHWLFAHWPEIEPGRFLYHYTSLDTLELIAGSSALRLGPLHRMNDPRETEPWELEVQYSDNFAMKGATTDLTEKANEFRQHTKLVCFGADEGASATAEDGAMGRWSKSSRRRGYLRPRMWAQYGDGGEGACIVLDRLAVDRAIVMALESDATVGRFGPCKAFNGRIDYSDAVETTLPATSLGRLQSGYSLESVIFEDDWVRAAFLVKDVDWATEHEYRWGLMTAAHGDDRDGSLDELFVPIPECVTGLVLGLRADNAHSGVQQFTNSFGINANVAKVRWRDNRLDLDLIDP